MMVWCWARRLSVAAKAKRDGLPPLRNLGASASLLRGPTRDGTRRVQLCATGIEMATWFIMNFWMHNALIDPVNFRRGEETQIYAWHSVQVWDREFQMQGDGYLSRLRCAQTHPSSQPHQIVYRVGLPPSPPLCERVLPHHCEPSSSSFSSALY